MLDDVVVGDVFLFTGQSNIDIPQTYGHQVYDPTLPGCHPQNDTTRGCSSFNETAQQHSERLADAVGLGKGLLRLMIVAAPSPTVLPGPALELPVAPNCQQCPEPGAGPYKACGCNALQWTRADANNIRGFSATGWFTGAALVSLRDANLGTYPPLTCFYYL